VIKPLTATAAMLAVAAGFAPVASAQLLRGGGLGSRLERLRDRASDKDSSIHYDPSVLTVGTARSSVVAAFGDPNATKGEGTSREDVYAFYQDGSKFVDPQVGAGTIAAAVFTAGMSLAVRQAKIMVEEQRITMYRVRYDAQDNIASVQVIPPEMGGTPAPASTPFPLQ
jgi:hypothetical protein